MYGVAVLVTFVIGVVAFGVFVLSKVFGGGSTEESSPAPAVVQASPSVRATPVPRKRAAQVLGVRAVVADARQVVVTVATPVGCAKNLRAVAYAEGVGAVAVRVTQEVGAGCRWQRKPVLVTAKAPVGDRTLIVNGTPWTPTESGEYQQALRASTS
ncbi:hypothetical protein [Kribbella voronezhensis]|uniref:hypothetical protein n=1 Tax=Kribbella voronezhensis TaxID=2512212 RepID=UPI001064347E|nr:hypothetical protein [Kribbella voronezhensis]